ncbi:sn-glycerol 3-phosphate transport system permease protein [Ketogulonicigenium robustum]|uniref:sn-glycerol-3-phosphate transport system permease protein UgpA n=1 Tax=Ketogulonicigenium robustum TaxID=92947 RepID=A0A1W6P1Q7_9RHOB|nr:ABC transporter permease subunit [Ketogulonicigenium robustum]ARO15260.1 sn-glycerol 3-phosphate transport system permease protein [Ketogulonicigenium robustum]
MLAAKSGSTITGGAPSRPFSALWARIMRAQQNAAVNGLKTTHFRKPGVAFWLLAPQALILLFFFYIPAYKALSLAFVETDPFGLSVIFVGFDNFTRLFASPAYRASAVLSLVFTLVQSVLTLGLATALAFATDRVVRGQAFFKGVILLPYAIAPVASGTIFAFMFNPNVGPMAHMLHAMGLPWNPAMRPLDAQVLVVMAAVWNHLCYDYIFLVAALLSVPRSLMEAAALDGAGAVKRFFTVSLPIIMPTFFFLMIMNLIYGLFDTFGLIETMTRGGPAAATNTLVYKVYQDGFVQLDLGSSAAQSVVLMGIAMAFTILQFRAVERRVNYTG